MSRTNRRCHKAVLEFVHVRVMAEYASSGLWLMQPAGVFRHCGINGEALRLPVELSAQFTAWTEAYFGLREEKPFDYDAFNQRGRELALALKLHLGPESYVEFVPEDAEQGIGQAEVIA